RAQGGGQEAGGGDRVGGPGGEDAAGTSAGGGGGGHRGARSRARPGDQGVRGVARAGDRGGAARVRRGAAREVPGAPPVGVPRQPPEDAHAAGGKVQAAGGGGRRPADGGGGRIPLPGIARRRVGRYSPSSWTPLLTSLGCPRHRRNSRVGAPASTDPSSDGSSSSTGASSRSRRHAGRTGSWDCRSRIGWRLTWRIVAWASCSTRAKVSRSRPVTRWRPTWPWSCARPGKPL